METLYYTPEIKFLKDMINNKVYKGEVAEVIGMDDANIYFYNKEHTMIRLNKSQESIVFEYLK